MRVDRDVTRRARAFAGRFLESTDGNIAMIFCMIAVIVIMAGGAAIDVARAVAMKTRLSSALDAAALAVGTQINMKEPELEAMAQKYFDANYPTSALGTTEDVELDQNGEKISLSVTGQVDTTLLRIIGIDEFDLNVTNEVTRSANNIEVALVLDITGSMCIPDCTKLNNLKVAAKDMVDMIVQDVQEPYYTKMAIVPYSSMVNVGTYANSVRGTIAAAKAITNVTWQNGASKTITAATKANPGVFTSTAHGLVAGDKIWISGVGGMTSLNDKPYVVSATDLTANTFKLKRWNSSNSTFDTHLDTSGYSTLTSGTDAIKKCVLNTATINGCDGMIVTSAGHGFADGARVVISGVTASTGGSTAASAVNNNTTDNNDANDTDGKRATWPVSSATTDTFRIPAVMPSGTTWAYDANTGSLYCTVQGCQYHRFTGYSETKVFPISTCVSERTGTNAYTDAAPSTTFLGRVYPASPGGGAPADANNPCISATITPLSIDKTALKSQIDGMTASGSTAGHIGTAWGWYMISPNFSYLWPTASQPAAYGTEKLFKIMILMTDGEFNTAYCNDVISQDSPHISGYSDRNDHKNCDAADDSFDQAETLCTNMKAEGKDVIVYTVGFAIGSDPNAQEIMTNCATDSDHDYYPNTGAELKTSFQSIAQEISQLRLSQ